MIFEAPHFCLHIPLPSTHPVGSTFETSGISPPLTGASPAPKCYCSPHTCSLASAQAFLLSHTRSWDGWAKMKSTQCSEPPVAPTALRVRGHGLLGTLRLPRPALGASRPAQLALPTPSLAVCICRPSFFGFWKGSSPPLALPAPTFS